MGDRPSPRAHRCRRDASLVGRDISLAATFQAGSFALRLGEPMSQLIASDQLMNAQRGVHGYQGCGPDVQGSLAVVIEAGVPEVFGCRAQGVSRPGEHRQVLFKMMPQPLGVVGLRGVLRVFRLAHGPPPAQASGACSSRPRRRWQPPIGRPPRRFPALLRDRLVPSHFVPDRAHRRAAGWPESPPEIHAAAAVLAVSRGRRYASFPSTGGALAPQPPDFFAMLKAYPYLLSAMLMSCAVACTESASSESESTAGAAGNGTGSEGASGSSGSNPQGGAAGVASPSAAGSAQGGSTHGSGDLKWVGTWANAPQLTESGNLPPEPGLSGNTLRQILFTSIGGDQIRLQISNLYGSSELVVNAVHIAKQVSGRTTDPATDASVTFSDEPSVTIAAGEELFSDALDFAIEPLTTLAVSIHFGDVPAGITGHPGSRTGSYIAAGDATSDAEMTSAVVTEHWYFLTGVDVMAPSEAAAVVAFGDSITDGRGATTNRNNRWPDNLSRRLRANPGTSQVAVLNMGIGGNALVSGGLGPSALTRFDRDVIGQRGVKWVIVLEGVNDIGGSSSASVADALIEGYEQLIAKAHDAGILIYGVPILPFGGSMYDSAGHETARQTVNEWIRTSGSFDAVIDLDETVRDPENPAILLGAYDSSDHLHPSFGGYEAMAAAIDLTLFSD